MVSVLRPSAGVYSRAFPLEVGECPELEFLLAILFRARPLAALPLRSCKELRSVVPCKGTRRLHVVQCRRVTLR